MTKIEPKLLSCRIDDCDIFNYMKDPIIDLEFNRPFVVVDNVSKEEIIGIPKLPEKYMITKPNKKGKCATILFWDLDNENNKTIVKLSKNDNYDKRLGFLIAYFQKHSGLSKTQANKYLDNLTEE